MEKITIVWFSISLCVSAIAQPLPPPRPPAGTVSDEKVGPGKVTTKKEAVPAEGKGAGIIPKKGGGLPPPSVPGEKKEQVQKSPPSSVPQGQVEPLEDTQEVFTFKTNFEKDIKCIRLPLNARINIDFEEAPLYDVVKFMACITQRNFIIGAQIKQGKTITIMSTTPVTVYEAYRAFLSALDINGLTIVPAGAFYKIIESGKAKTEMVPILGAKEKVPPEDRIITSIVPLKHIDVKDIEQVLNKFKTQIGDITSYQPGNSLIITDLGRNIQRMQKFIAELDVPTGKEKIWVRPIQYASAADMANLVTALFGDKAARAGGGGAQVGRAQAQQVQPGGMPGGAGAGIEGEGPATLSKVIADERTNSLIIVATPTAYLKIDKLLRRMDVPIAGEGQIHIYYLENANAEDVANTLSSLTAGTQAKAKQAGQKGGPQGAAALFEGEVKISPHKPTNSLIIESTLKDFLALKRVIQQLDVRRKQVYVEAVIMEISSNKDRKLGISGSGGMTFNIGGNTVPFLFGLGGLGISAFDMQQLSKGGLAIGLQGPLVDVATGTTGQAITSGALAIPSYGFLIQAIQSNSDVNVLSTPHILTMDNEEAEIVVGKQIPYQATSMGGLSSLLGAYGGYGLSSALGGRTTGTGTDTTGLSSLASLGYLGNLGMGYVQRIDVDLTLKITPQISESNFVRLKIQQSIDDVEAMDATLGPTTSKRKVSNVVVVKDQQPVVIGGLMRDIEITGVDKIPILGDIPVLGILFRKTAKRLEKRNLLMVITPYIIEDPTDLRRIHEQKMEEYRQFAEYMATKKKEMEGEIDFRKKVGVLEDIFATLEKARKDREALEQTKFEEYDIVGPPETHDLDYNPFAIPEEVKKGGGGKEKSKPESETQPIEMPKDVE